MSRTQCDTARQRGGTDAGVSGEATRMSKAPGLSRRLFCGVATATVATGPLGLFGFYRRVKALTDVATGVARQKDSGKTDIRPFHVNVSEADLHI